MMVKSFRIALAQINVTVGDIEANVKNILNVYADAAAHGADLIMFPEMTVTGYPAEDLVLRPSFQQEAKAAIRALALATADQDAAMIVGGLWREQTQLYNGAFLLEHGKVLHQRYKYSLPNYGVFDEKRHFTPGTLPAPLAWRGISLGLVICEELWHADALIHMNGADFYVSMNASPYETGKEVRRKNVARMLASPNNAPLLYLNMCGGQDDLLFDGQSFAINADAEYAMRFPSCREVVEILTVTQGAEGWEVAKGEDHSPSSPEQATYQAMVLGLRDYVEKNRFPGVILGLSGGIDSALTAAVAVDALGAARVRAVMMPSPYTSAESLEDAAGNAKALGITIDTIPISEAMAAFETMLAPSFEGCEPDTTEENLQARIRGTTLMALSNKLGAMVLTTGNKSEMAVGYATLYGDMCGGFSVLKDVYKTTVFALAHWRNRYTPENGLGPEGEVIPSRIITKPPTAELKPNQKDEDSLPPYDILDGILHGLVEQRLGVDAVVDQGYDRDAVLKILRMLTRAEYKRRQSAPGVKMTPMAFGKDWRYPITNRYKN